MCIYAYLYMRMYIFMNIYVHNYKGFNLISILMAVYLYMHVYVDCIFVIHTTTKNNVQCTTYNLHHILHACKFYILNNLYIGYIIYIRIYFYLYIFEYITKRYYSISNL